MHHLEWGNGRPGHIADGLPWDHKPYKDRLDKLEKDQKALEKTWPAYPNEEETVNMRRHYGHNKS